MPKNKFLPFLLPIVLLLVGLYLTPLNIFGPDLSRVPGDLGDARFNNYILEHDHHFFTGKVDKYWDAPFMYPYKNVIAFSDNLLGTAPIYSLFRLSGADRETAFQFWLLTLFILNFVFCYWALHKWSANNVLSATGAYIFSFSILLVGNIYNVQTFPRFIVPLVFYWCWQYFSLKDFKYFLFIALGIVYQFYCGIYLGFLLVYALLFFFIAHLIIYRDFSVFNQLKNIKTTGYHLIAVILACVLLLPLALPYVSISHEAGIPYFDDVFPSIPNLHSYFFTSTAPILWHSLSEHGELVSKIWWCHFLFIGALPWLGIAAVPFVLFLKKSDSNARQFISFLSLSLFLSFIFCLNINGFTLYKFIYKIPGFSVMRSMNRLINIEVLLFILVFVFVFNELRKYSNLVKWIVYAFPLLVILDNAIYPKEILSYNKKESQNNIENVKIEIQSQYINAYKAIAYMPDTVVNPVHFHIDVMLACQELNIHCVNAYSGHNPGHYNDFFGKMDKKSLLEWCDYNSMNQELIQEIHARKNMK